MSPDNLANKFDNMTDNHVKCTHLPNMDEMQNIDKQSECHVDRYCTETIPRLINIISDYLPSDDQLFFDYGEITRKAQQKKERIKQQIEALKFQIINQNCQNNIATRTVIPNMVAETEERIDQIKSELVKLKSDQNFYQFIINEEKNTVSGLKQQISDQEAEISRIKKESDNHQEAIRHLRKDDFMKVMCSKKESHFVSQLLFVQDILINGEEKYSISDADQVKIDQLQSKVDANKKYTQDIEQAIKNLKAEMKILKDETKKSQSAKSNKNGKNRKEKKVMKNDIQIAQNNLAEIDNKIIELEYELSFCQNKISCLGNSEGILRHELDTTKEQVKQYELTLTEDKVLIDTLRQFKDSLKEVLDTKIMPVLDKLSQIDPALASCFIFNEDDHSILDNASVIDLINTNYPGLLEKSDYKAEQRNNYLKYEHTPNKQLDLIYEINSIIKKIILTNIAIYSSEQGKSHAHNTDRIMSLMNKTNQLFISNVYYCHNFVKDYPKIKNDYRLNYPEGVLNELYQISLWQKYLYENQNKGIAIINSPIKIDKFMQTDMLVCFYDHETNSKFDLSKMKFTHIFPLQLKSSSRKINDNSFITMYLQERAKSWECGIPVITIDKYHISQNAITRNNLSDRKSFPELIGKLAEHHQEIVDYKNDPVKNSYNGCYTDITPHHLLKMQTEIDTLIEKLHQHS